MPGLSKSRSTPPLTGVCSVEWRGFDGIPAEDRGSRCHMDGRTSFESIEGSHFGPTIDSCLQVNQLTLAVTHAPGDPDQKDTRS